MKSGEEEYYVAGQIFTVGIVLMALLPRMPSDQGNDLSVGGKLSNPFRKGLLALVIIGLIRVVCFHHILFPYLDVEKDSFWSVVDSVLGILHTSGQSFLCLTTAYLLQCQLSTFINLGARPGANLVPYFFFLASLSLGGALGASLYHPNLWSLINLAETVSCIPVLQTLRLYTSVTFSQNQSGGLRQSFLRGPILTQILTIEEMWYLATSFISFIAEAIQSGPVQVDSYAGLPLQLILTAVRHNQDNGVDDWTRLLMHSIFLNSIDELTHVQQQQQQQQQGGADTHVPHTQQQEAEEGLLAEDNGQQALLVRRR